MNQAPQRVLVAIMALFVTQHAAAQCADGVQCELVWSDEFDGTSLDLAKWTHQTGTGCPDLCGWGNNELQFYVVTATTVDNGQLTITAEDLGNGIYSSARIRTLGKGDWTYGRIEMRAKLPEGQGMWPAFWLLPSDPNIYGVWAASGEIDVMESVGSDPERILGSLHYGDSYPGNVSGTSALRAPAGSVTQDFHTYAIEWQADVGCNTSRIISRGCQASAFTPVIRESMVWMKPCRRAANGASGGCSAEGTCWTLSS